MRTLQMTSLLAIVLICILAIVNKVPDSIDTKYSVDEEKVVAQGDSEINRTSSDGDVTSRENLRIYDENSGIEKYRTETLTPGIFAKSKHLDSAPPSYLVQADDDEPFSEIYWDVPLRGGTDFPSGVSPLYSKISDVSKIGLGYNDDTLKQFGYAGADLSKTGVLNYPDVNTGRGAPSRTFWHTRVSTQTDYAALESPTEANEAPGKEDDWVSDTVTQVAPFPEPATMLLLGAGLAGLAGMVIRRKKTTY